jgi:hypothetical protein
MIKKLLRFQFNALTFPVAAGLLLLTCFGLFLRQYGFFWDDWVQLLSGRLFGYPAYMRYFSERPLSGWTHIVFGPWMGVSPLRWEIFTLSLRWACVVCAWWLFQSLWPEHRRDAALAALLFAVYPGFTQQPISVAYHQHWLQYLLFLLSLNLMVLALRHKSYHLLLILLALTCQILQFSITEFFVGVELLRPFILWIIISHSTTQPLSRRQRLVKTSLNWFPYLLIFLAYAIWRGYLMPVSPQNQNAPSLLTGMMNQPFALIAQLFNFAAVDTMNSLIAVWGKVFDLRLATNQPVVILSWVASLLIACGFGLYLMRLQSHPAESGPAHRWAAVEMIVLGLLGTLVGPAPLWLANKNILWAVNEDFYHSDRFTLAAMLWASLFFVGLIAWLVDRWKAKVVILAVILGLLVGFQMRVANDYRWLSTDQSHFYWQLAWRAPGIQTGTALITEDILFPYQGIFSTASAINLLYPQPQQPDLIAYWMYSIKPRFNTNNTDVHSISFDTHQRLTHFVGQTPDSLVLLYGAPKSNCLWILRPQDSDYPELSPLIKNWLPVSNLQRINANRPSPDYPSPQLFGAEPEHGWCYYFEKADLARQTQDWNTAAALGDEAQQKGYQPDRSGSNVIYEWLPFVEAYAHVGRWQDAAIVMQKNMIYDPAIAPFVCSRWQSLYQQVPQGNGREQANQTILQKTGCH